MPLAYPADRWVQNYDIWIVLAVVIFLIVTLPMLYFIFRSRYKKAVNERGADEHGHVGIEVLWTVVPLIVVLYLAVQSSVIERCDSCFPCCCRQDHGRRYSGTHDDDVVPVQRNRGVRRILSRVLRYGTCVYAGQYKSRYSGRIRKMEPDLSYVTDRRKITILQV